MTTGISIDRATGPATGADAPVSVRPDRPHRIALLGNPNTGKTTLFNRLTGLRHKTSNFPGTTLEARVGRLRAGATAPGATGVRPRSPVSCACGTEHDRGEDATVVAPNAPSPAHPLTPSPPHATDLIDLPGIYSLELDQLEAEVCREVLQGRAAPSGQPLAEPDAVCVVADATNLARNLLIVGEALRRRLPTVVALNMTDLARRQGLHIDGAKLEAALGCPVIPVSARTGEGLAALESALAAGGARIGNHTPPGTPAGLRQWADDLYAAAASGDPALDADSFTDRLDRVVTHPVLGIVCFVAIMAGLFYSIFALARFPMEWIDDLFKLAGQAATALLPDGAISQLVSDGILSGVGVTMVFIPQIALLFFLISLLEDTGYLARAAFVVDRALRPFGLPGHAFVPLLSSHACALPGIMATRGIPDRRERLATILVAPFMSCSARLPVYVLVTMVLFRDRPAMAALAFVGCYALGITAGIFSALVARRTILRGRSRPMALELPTYKVPSFVTALLTTWDRVKVFLLKAGTNIVAISIILWWLGAFPQIAPPQSLVDLRSQARAQARALEEQQRGMDPITLAHARELHESTEASLADAERANAAREKAGSFVGRLGRTVQPVFAPLGYDWKLTVGVLTSFAARETFVSTMGVVTAGNDDKDDPGVLKQIATATRDDGSPVFAPAVCWSLLVYYVLAMQCLPTLAVTAREAGGVRWAFLQLAWMSGLAYLSATLVYQLLR